MSLQEKLNNALAKREEANLLRKLPITNTNLIDFASNDYLGLSRNPQVLAEVQQNYEQTNQWIGSGGSRLLAGNYPYYEELEHFLAEVHQGESALLFNSGYVANLGFFATIPQKGDTILYDKLIHACVKEGVRLSFANHYSFAHNDLIALEKQLQKVIGNVFVVVESVYSMDGDEAPLVELVELCEKYNAYLVVDEAHTTGIYGQNGGGLVCHLGLEKRVFARIHTFGKAIGAHGACIIGPEYLKNYLINFSRQFIYTTSLSIHSLVAIKTSYLYIQKKSKIQEELKAKITLFKKYFTNTLVNSNSPIQVVLVKGNEEIRKVANELQSKGMDIRPILSPTVKAGTERLRICIHVHNSNQEIELLAKELQCF